MSVDVKTSITMSTTVFTEQKGNPWTNNPGVSQGTVAFITVVAPSLVAGGLTLTLKYYNQYGGLLYSSATAGITINDNATTLFVPSGTGFNGLPMWWGEYISLTASKQNTSAGPVVVYLSYTPDSSLQFRNL